MPRLPAEVMEPQEIQDEAHEQVLGRVVLRIDLTRERTRHYSRLEKLLEDALIQVSAVASTTDTMPVRDMVEALIAGERDPQVLAQVDALTTQIDRLTIRIEDRLDEITGIGRDAAQVIIAEIGLRMEAFPPATRCRGPGLSPATMQSGTRSRSAPTGKGDPSLKGVLGSAVAAAARTDTFLGQRYRRLVRRRGKPKALVAVARSILVIVWHLLSDPAARYHHLGSDYYTSKTDKVRNARGHIRQLEAPGYTVTLAPAA